MKTNEIADEIGVSPRTVRDWVKRYKIPCIKNEFGHYVYDEVAVKRIIGISGKVTIPNLAEKKSLKKNLKENGTDMSQLEKVLERLVTIEKQLDQKADDVVSYQLLQQRREIEELTKKVETLELSLLHLEKKLTAKNDTSIQENIPANLPKKRRGIAKTIFSIF